MPVHLPRLRRRRHLLCAVALVAAGNAFACSVEQAPAERAASCARTLARTINFGNMLEHAREGLAGPMLRDEFVVLSKQAGFTAIRLPVRWDARAGYQPPYTISAEFLARVDGVVKLASAHGLSVILDMHHYASMMMEPQAEQARFVALWRQVAEHYRDAPPTVMFEVLNEPNRALTQSLWNQALAEVIPAIRASNPRRTLIIGGSEWNSRHSLATLALPKDDRDIIATFHYYDPMPFTHQGAEWVSGAGGWLGTRWTAAQRSQVRDDFAAVKRWAETQGRPVFLGEFGAYSRADETSRVAWTTAVREEAEAHGFGWAYWELASSFGVLDPHALSWREPLLQSLLPTSPVLKSKR